MPNVSFLFDIHIRPTEKALLAHDFYAFLAQTITDFLWVSKPHVSSVSPLICFHSVGLSYGDSL